MLHRLTIGNFFSIAEDQELDFRVSANAPDLECFRDSQSMPGLRLPVIVALYGPNASGKSTVLRAITATANFVLHSFTGSPDGAIPLFSPFANNDWAGQPTKIVIEYDSRLSERSPVAVFRYELNIANEPGRIAGEVVRESLHYKPRKKFMRIFDRDRQEFVFGREFDLPNGDPRIRSIRPNASIVSTLAHLNHKPSSDFIRSLQGLHTNILGFDKAVNVLSNVLTVYSLNPEYLRSLNRELSRLDLGLEEMKIQPGPSGPIAMFRHSGLDSDIFIGQESAGTRRFIEIFPILQHVLDFGGLAVIDELDTDIHPSLVPEIFRWFYDPQRNRQGAQLIFTAHNPAILDDLEKEQVFFSEKPRGGATRIYGASEIQGLRRGVSLARKYLAGELGAVPHIG